jgi:hypothetical protein
MSSARQLASFAASASGSAKLLDQVVGNAVAAPRGIRAAARLRRGVLHGGRAVQAPVHHAVLDEYRIGRAAEQPQRGGADDAARAAEAVDRPQMIGRGRRQARPPRSGAARARCPHGCARRAAREIRTPRAAVHRPARSAGPRAGVRASASTDSARTCRSAAARDRRRPSPACRNRRWQAGPRSPSAAGRHRACGHRCSRAAREPRPQPAPDRRVRCSRRKAPRAWNGAARRRRPAVRAR